MDSSDRPGDGPTGELSDWLFEPAVDSQPEPWVHGARPWRVASQVYVAFFGGVAAIAAIAALNTRRLGLSRGTEQRIWGLAVAGLIAVCIAAVLIDPQPGAGTGASQAIRWVNRGIALVLYFVFARMQRASDRVFALRSGEYAPLWVPGFVAVIVGGVAQGLLIAGVVAAL